jgi:hypothetical protein
MNDKQAKLLKLQFRPNCFVLISPSVRDSDRPHDIDNMNYVVSFLYHNPITGWAAEWEPRYGPIQLWHECPADAPNARPHYFFEFVDNGPGTWSQMAVENEGLHTWFYESGWGFIFNILATWADRK